MIGALPLDQESVQGGVPGANRSLVRDGVSKAGRSGVGLETG